jgi:hypothetical protein
MCFIIPLNNLMNVTLICVEIINPFTNNVCKITEKYETLPRKYESLIVYKPYKRIKPSQLPLYITKVIHVFLERLLNPLRLRHPCFG